MIHGPLIALARYIRAADILAYEAQGWRVSLIGFHHGCNGYALAVLDLTT